MNSKKFLIHFSVATCHLCQFGIIVSNLDRARKSSNKVSGGSEEFSRRRDMSTRASLLWVVLAVLYALCTGDENSIVSCGSVIKLKHKESGHHLHSHQIAWGSGSGQQSVTGHGSNNGKQCNSLSFSMP